MVGGAGALPAAPGAARTAEDMWNEAAGSLSAKIMEHLNSGIALALAVKNTSSLGEEDVFKIRRALRNQLRNQRVRFATGKQARADVQVTLSENSEGYVWIAEIRDHLAASATSDDVRDIVVMVPVERPSVDDRHATAEPLIIRKARIYEQSSPILDVALLDNAPGAPEDPRANEPVARRILVLGLDSVSLYEKTETAESAAKNAPHWRLAQTAALTRVRAWPRDARGRIIVHGGSLFDAYLPGTKCTGALEPALTLECHESDEPWPLSAGERGATPAPPLTQTGPAAYFTADRNYFDGRIKLDEGREVKAFPFVSLVVMPSKGAAHAGLPAPAGHVPPNVMDVPGWVLSGLDGRAQLLNSSLQPVANVGGWGSQIVGLQTGCGAGWQVLASQARDLSQPDAVQAYEIADRKPTPASSPVEFAGPIMELLPLASGSQALAISRNLQTSTYEAFRLSISCSD